MVGGIDETPNKMDKIIIGTRDTKLHHIYIYALQIYKRQIDMHTC